MTTDVRHGETVLPKVLYDHQIFDIQIHGGISRYYSELIRRFRLTDEVIPSIGMGFSDNCYVTNTEFKAIFTHPRKINLNVQRLIGPNDVTERAGSSKFNKMLRVLSANRSLSVKALRKGDFEVFHPTYYDTYFLRHLRDRPFVLTIYDMIHEKFISSAKPNPIIARKKELAEKADLIIAISESTKRDVVDLLGVPANKVHVTYLAGSLPAPTTPGALEGLPSKYLLFVGLRGGYKNFEFMLKALEPVFQSHPDVHLICVGGGPFNEVEAEKIKLSKGYGRIRQMSVPDHILSRLYSNALVYINPSRYEGFGIPVLEAMTCGCPTLISRVSSLPEVGGDAAAYFELDDEIGFREALIPLLDDAELGDEHRQRGLVQASRFSWTETAAMTRDIYASLLR